MVSTRMKIQIKLFLERLNTFLRHRYVFAIIFITLVLALLGTVSGYTAYIFRYGETSGKLTKCEDNTLNCLEELNTTKTSYKDCNERATEISESLQKSQLELSGCLNQIATNLSSCLQEKQSMLIDNKELADAVSSCKLSSGSLNITLQKLQADYQALLENAAKNICCKRKVDDPSLRYYYVEDSKIVCTSNATDITVEFFC
jgi:hypothetical protein